MRPIKTHYLAANVLIKSYFYIYKNYKYEEWSIINYMFDIFFQC
jgi:hypothetical protein